MLCLLIRDESTYRLDQALANAEVSLAQWQQTQQTFAGESVLHTGAIEETKSKSKQVQVEIEQAKVALVNAKVRFHHVSSWVLALHPVCFIAFHNIPLLLHVDSWFSKPMGNSVL